MAWTLLGIAIVIYLLIRTLSMDTSKPIERTSLDKGVDNLLLKIKSKMPWR